MRVCVCAYLCLKFEREGRREVKMSQMCGLKTVSVIAMTSHFALSLSPSQLVTSMTEENLLYLDIDTGGRLSLSLSSA